MSIFFDTIVIVQYNAVIKVFQGNVLWKKRVKELLYIKEKERITKSSCYDDKRYRIQENQNGRFVIEFDGINLNFSFTKGKSNR